MKKILSLLGLMVLLTGALVNANLRKKVGSVGERVGKVTVDGKSAEVSTDLREGSVIETGRSSRATLLLGKGAVFHLGEESKMVVTAFGVKKAESEDPSRKEVAEEVGELDLKFGKTRALILNRAGEKKDLKIRARSATMGVRGTEVFIASPKDLAKPVQFFTLEGLAEVKTFDGAPPIPVAQNEGVAATGNPPATAQGSSGGGADSSGSTSNGSSGNAQSGGQGEGGGAKPSAGANDSQQSGPAAQSGGGAESKADAGVVKVSAQEVKSEIQSAGFAPPPAIRTPGQAMPVFQPPPISMMPSFFQNNPQPILGPNDREKPNLSITPSWCSGTRATCP